MTASSFLTVVETTVDDINDEFGLDIKDDENPECGNPDDKLVDTDTSQVILCNDNDQEGEHFCDRHIFSHLCYRNFAQMEAIPFIQSVQRVTYLKGAAKSIVEQQLQNGAPFSTGVLWKRYLKLL